MENRALVFLTIHNENDEHNPQSVIMIDALREYGCASFVLKYWNPCSKETLKTDNALVVPLFDVKVGVNRWSPCPAKAPGIPEWAQDSSTGSCVAIGPKCVNYPSHIEDATQQISNMFLRELRKNGNSNGNPFPWGLGPSSERHKRRTWRQLKPVRR